MPKRTKNLDEFLREQLRDGEEAAAYVSACLVEGHEALGTALGEVAAARGVDVGEVRVGSVRELDGVLRRLGLRLAVRAVG